jgi:hypothetical protein
MALSIAAATLSVAAFGAEKAVPAAGRESGSRIRVVRSWPEPVTSGGKTALGRVEIAFDYDEGVVIERVIAADGKVVSTTVRRKGEGAPRPTPEEIEEAKEMVRADAELSRVIDQAGAQLDGGFILNEAQGRPCGPGTRCVQIQIETADGLGFIRWVVVDLTKQSFAYRTYMPSAMEGQ